MIYHTILIFADSEELAPDIDIVPQYTMYIPVHLLMGMV